MKKTIFSALALLAGVLLTFGKVSAQSPASSGLPVYKDTGNPQADEAAYKAAKEAWLKANPGKVSQIENVDFNSLRVVDQPTDPSAQKEKEKIASQPVEVKTISLAEFSAFPATRQQFVRENSHLFKVVDQTGKVITNY